MPYVEYDEVEAICSDCGRTFRSEEALAAHHEESHSGVEARVAVPHARRATFSCPICHRSFAAAGPLRAHTRVAHRPANPPPTPGPARG